MPPNRSTRGGAGSPRHRGTEGLDAEIAGTRPGLADCSGRVLALLAVLPPVSGYARQYAFVQALQFVMFAVVVPAVLVLGITSRPGRAVRRATDPDAPPGRWERAVSPTLRLLAGTAGHRADADRRAVRAAAAKVLFFVALVVTWRLPMVLDALARYPALVAAEGDAGLRRLGGLGRPCCRDTAEPAAAAAAPRRHSGGRHVEYLGGCLRHRHVRCGIGQLWAKRGCAEACHCAPARSRGDVGGAGHFLRARRVRHADPVDRRARRSGRRTSRSGALRLQRHRSQPPAATAAWLALAAGLTAASAARAPTLDGHARTRHDRDASR